MEDPTSRSAWFIFSTTGNPNYYLLYRSLEKPGSRKEHDNNIEEDPRLR